MALVKLAIDYEFASKTWWKEGGEELWDAVNDGLPAVLLDADIAQSWIAQAATIQGWDEGPEYAPHPITLSPIDDEDADLV